MNWNGMYLCARSWGIQPDQFWNMTIGEWQLEAAQKYEEATGGKPVPGQLRPDEFERLRALIED